MADWVAANEDDVLPTHGSTWSPEWLLKSLNIAFQNQLTSESKQIQGAVWDQEKLSPPVKELESMGVSSDHSKEVDL